MGLGLIIGFIAYLQLGITSNYNATQISIIHTSLLSLLESPLVVASSQSSNNGYNSCSHGSRTSLSNRRLKSVLLCCWPPSSDWDCLDCLPLNLTQLLTIGFRSPDIASGRTPQKTPFLAAAILQSDAAVLADRTENTVSNTSSIVVWRSCQHRLHRKYLFQWYFHWWRSVACSIVASLFIVPLPSNGCLFHSPCHNIKALYNIKNCWILFFLLNIIFCLMFCWYLLQFNVFHTFSIMMSDGNLFLLFMLFVWISGV
jgi:hypothetical protein